MRISLIGPGDVEYHFQQLLGMSKEEFERHVDEIGAVLAQSGSDIVLTPDQGIPLNVAKTFRMKNPRGKVYGLVPKADLEFGMEHILRYMDSEVQGEKVFDDFINAGNWYKLDVSKAATGDDVLLLGKSLGSIGEFALGFYLYKLLAHKKPGVAVEREDIGSHIRAGRIIPFTAIIYLPFVKERMDYEIEAYIRKVGGKILYVRNPQELKNVLEGLQDEYNGKIPDQNHVGDEEL